MKKALSIILALLMLTTVVTVQTYAEGDDGIIEITEDGNYTLGDGAYTAVTIDGVSGKVTLKDLSVISAGRSAILVKGGSNVVFVIKGHNTVEGDADAYSCGIEVEYGSTVTFEGDGTLNVTGGKWGAAIGSYGTDINIPENERVKVGEIIINSGNINAYAGRRGAGIGAGYHVNGNIITINGGVIHAYGNECGAGIGCGYGTSGGAIGVAAVGEYDSGRIVINGGEVYAATAWDQSFDLSDLSKLNENDPGTFAAGIGGGYGASASDIEINGGTVIAIGSCGGAGIGAGRGSSKASKYNQNAYKSNVKITGNADVTAISATSRSNELNSGGAAIGSGRGSHTGGTIEITGNAKVTAISATKAPAIGASKQPSPVDGAIPVAEKIVIGDNVDLFAVSAGDYAVDKDASEFVISDDYFGSSDRYFFDETAAALTGTEDVKVESTKGEKGGFTVPGGSGSLWTNIKKPEIKDDEGDAQNAQSGAQDANVKKGNLKIVAPLAMALRFENGGVYYSGDEASVELDTEYCFQMCCVDWSTRDDNGEKKIHKAYETFYPNNSAWKHSNHGVYEDADKGLRGSVVYRFEVSSSAKKPSYDEESKKFIIPKAGATLRTDVNKCFMAYRFKFSKGDYNKQTGIDKVVYDTGREHVNTLEDFRYNKPLESLSVNLPLGSTVNAVAFNNYSRIGDADVFVEIDSEHPDRSYTDYYWPY